MEEAFGDVDGAPADSAVRGSRREKVEDADGVGRVARRRRRTRGGEHACTKLAAKSTSE
jgi:hypothetical protein